AGAVKEAVPLLVAPEEELAVGEQEDGLDGGRHGGGLQVGKDSRSTHATHAESGVTVAYTPWNRRSRVKERTREDLAAIRRSGAVAAVSEIQQESVQKGKDAIAPMEIDAEIASVRRARSRIRQPVPRSE